MYLVAMGDFNAWLECFPPFRMEGKGLRIWATLDGCGLKCIDPN